MKPSLSSLLALSALLLLGAATAHAQQAPASTRQGTSARKPAPGQRVSSTAKRNSATTKAAGANSTSATATQNNSDTPNTVNANGSIGSQESADGKGQGVYAAPGMPVNPATGRKKTSYDGPAAKPASSTKNSTLKPAGKP